MLYLMRLNHLVLCHIHYENYKRRKVLNNSLIFNHRFCTIGVDFQLRLFTLNNKMEVTVNVSIAIKNILKYIIKDIFRGTISDINYCDFPENRLNLQFEHEGAIWPLKRKVSNISV